MKKVLVTTIAAAFVLGAASLAIAETVTRIAGTKVTVVDAAGRERTVDSDAKGLKVGDKVTLTERDGRTWLNPQPEPPKPERVQPAKLVNPALRKGPPATPEAPPPPPPPDRPKLK